MIPLLPPPITLPSGFTVTMMLRPARMALLIAHWITPKSLAALEMFADHLLCPDLDDTIRDFAAQLRKGGNQ